MVYCQRLPKFYQQRLRLIQLSIVSISQAISRFSNLHFSTSPFETKPPSQLLNGHFGEINISPSRSRLLILVSERRIDLKKTDTLTFLSGCHLGKHKHQLYSCDSPVTLFCMLCLFFVSFCCVYFIPTYCLLF